MFSNVTSFNNIICFHCWIILTCSCFFVAASVASSQIQNIHPNNLITHGNCWAIFTTSSFHKYDTKLHVTGNYCRAYTEYNRNHLHLPKYRNLENDEIFMTNIWISNISCLTITAILQRKCVICANNEQIKNDWILPVFPKS